MNRRLWACLLAASALVAPSVLHAQTVANRADATVKPLRLHRDIKGDAKLVHLDADQIATWTEESGGRVLLLRGQVMVQLESERIRFQQGVVWIDTKSQNGTNRVTIYAADSVSLENGADVSEAPVALLDYVIGGTLGDAEVKAHPGPIVQKSLPNDPLYRRALQERGALPTTVPATLAVKKADAVPLLPPVIQQTRYEEKADETPSVAPRNPIQLTQILGPALPPVVPPVSPPLAPLPIMPGPNTPPPLPPPSSIAPPMALPPVAIAPLQRLSVSPRTSAGFQISAPPGDPIDPERKTFIITGGAIITVRGAPGVGVVDLEADRVVIWTRGVNSQDFLTNNGLQDNKENREIEFYLSGNVEIRQQGPKDSRTMRAEEVYYDVNRSVAISINTQIEFRAPPRLGIADPIVFRAQEIVQHAENQYEILKGEVFSSKLPSDPGLKVYFVDGTVENRTIPRLSAFGLPVTNRRTGQQDDEQELYFKGRNVFFELENIPFFYSPYLAGNLLNPLGPVEDITAGYNKIFGVQAGVTLNIYDLLGVQPYEGTKWRLHLDGLSARGPAVGSTFDATGKDLFGIPNIYDATLSGYAIYDDGYDVLGGGRNSNISIPAWRGRALWRENVQGLPNGFTVQSQISYLSDHNFLEQYFWREFATDINQETFLYVKQQQDYWAWTALIEARLDRPWVTEGERLPEVAGHVITVPFLDQLFTYSANGSLGYYQLRTSDVPEPPVSPTDMYDRTGRFHVMQELDLPFAAGPLKIVPYIIGDFAEYTQDLNNEEVGRVWGGGGVRTSIPFTRLYPDIQSELLNLNGINHKIVVSSNFIWTERNLSHTNLPQIDRLNDDATDQALRDIRVQENAFLPGGPGLLLSGYPLYDPQIYALRQLIFNRIDSLDNIEELQLDIRQRWQTKRGYPGNEHTVDWMTLDISGAYFPNTRDNFNSDFAFLQYDWLWNIGDRTALTSTAWVDPMDHGAREYTFGAYLNRPDRTNFYIGYRQIDPLQSRAVTAAVSYVFSPKYSMTASSTYDFGTQQAQSNQLIFTRTGSDMQVSVGVTYNAIQSNFGALFEIVPNLVPANKRPGVVGALGQGGLLSN